MEIASYEDLIKYLKSLPTKQEQIDFLMDWFVKNVEYDYVILEKAKALGHLDEELSEIDRKFDCKDEKQRKLAIGYAKEKYGFSDEFIDRTLAHYGKTRIIAAQSERKAFGKVWPAQPERTIIDGFRSSVALQELPTIFDNGLIKKGVCADYTKFIAKVCADLGIKCECVEGMTSVGHQWTILENKHYDPTYAIFVRDKYADWDKKTKIMDWFNVEATDLIKIQPYRKICLIDGVVQSNNCELEK